MKYLLAVLALAMPLAAQAQQQSDYPDDTHMTCQQFKDMALDHQRYQERLMEDLQAANIVYYTWTGGQEMTLEVIKEWANACKMQLTEQAYTVLHAIAMLHKD